MHIGPAVVTKQANSGSLSCAAARTTVLGPEESPQLFAHGRRVVRWTHSEGGATHHTTRDINALNFIMIVGLAHDRRPKFSVQETRTRNSQEKLRSYVMHSRTSFFSCEKLVPSSSQLYSVRETWLKSSGLTGRQVMFRNKVVFTSVYNNRSL